MLWLKAFHVIFVVTWFAGLFYLPRLFVYHAEASEAVVRDRLKIMERRLLMITHIGGALAVVFGLLTLGAFAHASVDYLQQGWLHAKLGLVVLLIAYHAMLVKMVGEFVDYKEVPTKNGKKMWFGCFLDAEGDFFDTVHFPNATPSVPFRGPGCYLIQAKVVVDFGFASLEVKQFAKLGIKGNPVWE